MRFRVSVSLVEVAWGRGSSRGAGFKRKGPMGRSPCALRKSLHAWTTLTGVLFASRKRT